HAGRGRSAGARGEGGGGRTRSSREEGRWPLWFQERAACRAARGAGAELRSRRARRRLGRGVSLRSDGRLGRAGASTGSAGGV
ncbi:unnamed protein product, partial [Durusdinium trenchii]